MVDFVLLFILEAVTGDLLVSVGAARVCSSMFSHATNRTLVFDRRGRVESSAVSYFSSSWRFARPTTE
jgi:putative flippase GtrA